MNHNITVLYPNLCYNKVHYKETALCYNVFSSLYLHCLQNRVFELSMATINWFVDSRRVSHEVALLILIIVLKSWIFIFALFHGNGSDVIINAWDPGFEGVLLTYSKICLKQPLKNRQNKDLNDKR